MPAPTELEDRVLGGLVAFAAGDALGLPWEGRPPMAVQTYRLVPLPGRPGWPPGSTSDDTALTLLVAEHLVAEGGTGDPLRFLAVLAEQANGIRGLGPSTSAAVDHFRLTGTPSGAPSATNGGPMRALPVGWSLPAAAADRRRARTVALTAVTHAGRDALAAACVASACAGWAVDGPSPDRLVTVALEEAMALAEPASPRLVRALAAVAAGVWRPAPAGTGLDAVDTVAAVLHCCREAGGELPAALPIASQCSPTASNVPCGWWLERAFTVVQPHAPRPHSTSGREGPPPGVSSETRPSHVADPRDPASAAIAGRPNRERASGSAVSRCR